jgi:hypothetical protein
MRLIVEPIFNLQVFIWFTIRVKTNEFLNSMWQLLCSVHRDVHVMFMLCSPKISVYLLSLIDMHRRCKIILHGHPIRNHQSSISYEESGVKWGDVAEYMVVIGWQCKIILHCRCIQIKSLIYINRLTSIHSNAINHLSVFKEIYIFWVTLILSH